MFEAIHKPTKKRVSSFKLINDLEWHGKEKDEFTAPYDSIDNWEELSGLGVSEVKVIFIKKFKRYEGTDKEETVTEHFRIETHQAIESRWNESEEHKLAKQYIYQNIDKITILNLDNKKVSELGEIEDIRIERGVGSKRADVLITFKEWHEFLGRGIAFEVQISPQNEEETSLRSYDRASHGFSIVWIWSKDLRQFKNLVKIIPFAQALKEYNEMVDQKSDERINEIGQKSIRFINKLLVKVGESMASNKYNLDKSVLDAAEMVNRYDQQILSKVREKSELEVQEIVKNILKEIDLTPSINHILKQELLWLIKNEINFLVKDHNEKIEIKVNENVKFVDCFSCKNKTGFIIIGEKSYCKECAYKEVGGWKKLK